MDETRSTGDKEGSDTFGRREVAPSDAARQEETPHDPVTGTPAAKDETRQGKHSGRKKSSGEVERDIRHTRAEMSETVDALEHRLSPERLKHEAKGTVHETIDEVRDRFHPRHMANRAGRSMMDTIKEHPVPALTAGLSLGYLFMKAGERSRSHRGHGEYRRGGYGAPYYRRGYYAEPESYTAERYGSYRERYPGRYSSEPGYRRPPYEEEAYAREADSGQEKPATEQAKEKAGEVKKHASEQARQVQERASQQAHQVQERTQEASRRMQHSAHRAQSEVERFAHDNPLAAGALAVGIGALLGNMFSSTEKENKWMGPARDEVTHRAEKAAADTMKKASQSAERVGEEARQAAEDVKKTAKTEAEKVKEEGKRQAKEKSKQ